MKEYRLPQNEKLVKEYLFSKLASTQARKTSRIFSGMFSASSALKFAGALAVLLLVVAFVAKDNVALAEFNPLATPTAKAKHVLKRAISNVELENTRNSPSLPGNSSSEAKELDEAFNAKDLKLISDDQETEQENISRNNQQFQVDGQTVENLGQALKLKPKEVKKQVRFTKQDGKTVFLGFNREGEVIFKAESTTERPDSKEGSEQGDDEQEAPKERVRGARTKIELRDRQESVLDQTSKPQEATPAEQNSVGLEAIKLQDNSSKDTESAEQQKEVETEIH
jgi:hypothetical protein